MIEVEIPNLILPKVENSVEIVVGEFYMKGRNLQRTLSPLLQREFVHSILLFHGNIIRSAVNRIRLNIGKYYMRTDPWATHEYIGLKLITSVEESMLTFLNLQKTEKKSYPLYASEDRFRGLTYESEFKGVNSQGGIYIDPNFIKLKDKRIQSYDC